MNNILAAVQDNFKDISVTYDRVTKLTSNTHSNLVAVTLLIQSIVDNKEFIEEGKTKIITDIIDWLNKKFDNIINEIDEQYNHNSYIKEYLKESQKKILTFFLVYKSA